MYFGGWTTESSSSASVFIPAGTHTNRVVTQVGDNCLITKEFAMTPLFNPATAASQPPHSVSVSPWLGTTTMPLRKPTSGAHPCLSIEDRSQFEDGEFRYENVPMLRTPVADAEVAFSGTPANIRSTASDWRPGSRTLNHFPTPAMSTYSCTVTSITPRLWRGENSISSDARASIGVSGAQKSWARATM